MSGSWVPGIPSSPNCTLRYQWGSPHLDLGSTVTSSGGPSPTALFERGAPAAPIPLCGLAFSRSPSHRPSLPHVSFLSSPHTRSSPRTDLCALGAMLTGVQRALLLNEAPPPHRVTDCAKAERGSARSPCRRGHSACPRRAPALPSVRHSPTCSPLSFR